MENERPITGRLTLGDVKPWVKKCNKLSSPNPESELVKRVGSEIARLTRFKVTENGF